MKPRIRQAGAFTLIEIMMVVAILGLTLTMGIPSFVRTLKREGMGKLDRELVQACQDARRQAIMSGNKAYLTIRPLDRTFKADGGDETCTIPNDIVIEALGINFIPYEGAEQARVQFNPNGTSDEFIIILHSSDGSYRTIYLDNVSALPRVETKAFNPYQK